MIRRITQFIRAINASLSPADRDFLAEHLSMEERALFDNMAIYDQRHVLNVAYTALNLLHKLSPADSKLVNRELLVKACLLHDIGRNKKDVKLLDKVLAVLIANKLSSAILKWGLVNHIQYKNQASWLSKRCYAIYVYHRHPHMGYRQILELVDKYSQDEKKSEFYRQLAQLIYRHHRYEYPASSIELDLLQKADSLN